MASDDISGRRPPKSFLCGYLALEVGRGRAKSFLPDSKGVLSPPRGAGQVSPGGPQGPGSLPLCTVAAQAQALGVAFPHAHRGSPFQSKFHCGSDDDDDDDISLSCFRARWAVPGPVPAQHLSLSLETASRQHLPAYRPSWRRFQDLPEAAFWVVGAAGPMERRSVRVRWMGAHPACRPRSWG